jgi:Ca2+-transporting ATPase
MRKASAADGGSAASPSNDPAIVWHVLSVSEAVTRLASTAGVGLTADEAARRLGIHGTNELREQARRNAWQMLFSQFTDFMILLLLAAAAISGVVGEAEDAIAILAIVILNAIIGFVQEYRAEQALQALKKLGALKAKVVRNGQVVTVAAKDLVPGDLVLLEAGSVVPADIRITEVAQLRIEEAALTGESQAVEKQISKIAEADAPLGDRLNMAYSGTIVTYGRGRGYVVVTGMDTELGKIATLLATTDEVRTPLQKRLAKFGRQLSIVAIAICVVVFVLGVLRGESMVLMFLTCRKPRGRRRARGAARGGHDCARARCQADGQEECTHPPSAGSRNAGIRHLYLFGQDRNADSEPDACRCLLRRWQTVQGIAGARGARSGTLELVCSGAGAIQRCRCRRAR